MTENQTSYRQIFKATSLFGGVQVFNIIITIVRSKFVAVLLGPLGMGISGLLTNTTSFVSALTNFGLGTSAVKSLAAEATTGDNSEVSTLVSVIRRLVWITGFLGMILTVILSAWLSELAFGNRDYKFAIIWISVTILFQQISSGQIVILQGLRQLQYLAKANILGAVIGLLISIPVYFVWRIDGIVPVIIISSLSSMLLSWYYTQKIRIHSVKITLKETRTLGKEMMEMGFILSISSLITIGASYIVRIYISNAGGIEQVGFYNAGFAMINTYVGMIFTAMSTDYYPRLSAVAHDDSKSCHLINQQAEVAILIIAPMLSVFLVFINWIVIVLYSQKFLVVNEMIHWAALGMYFKAVSWSIAFIFLAKGASKLFFWNEFFYNLYLFGLNIVGYRIAGLEGLGISFLVAYFVYFIQVFIITKIKHSFVFEKAFYQIAGIQLIIGLLCFAIVRTLNSSWSYVSGSILIIISVVYSLRELEKRIGIKDIIHARVKSFCNN